MGVVELEAPRSGMAHRGDDPGESDDVSLLATGMPVRKRAQVQPALPLSAADASGQSDLRLLVSAWCAYERRWVQAPSSSSVAPAAAAAATQTVTQESSATKRRKEQKNIEASLVDEEFERELEGFHALVVHLHVHEHAHAHAGDETLSDVGRRCGHSMLVFPRLSLRQRVREWIGMEARVRDWWHPRSDLALACLADLQLVVPGVWIGSAVTLQHADAVAKRKITHVLHCTTAAVATKSTRLPSTTADASPPPQQQQSQLHKATPVVQAAAAAATAAAASPFPSTFAYTITLSEVPRLEWLQHERSAAGESSRSASQQATTTMTTMMTTTVTWQELETTSKFLLGIVRLQDKFAASALLDAVDAQTEAEAEVDGDETVGAMSNDNSSGEMGLLLYCDSGVSTSIAVCAALLMYRFCLPLRLAMLLLRSARRFVAPSPYLQHQLELYESELGQRRRRQGLRLPLHRNPK